MSGQPQVSMTPQELQDLMIAAIAEAVKPRGLEAKRLAEEEAKEARKLAMSLSLAEGEAIKSKQRRCTHKRYPANSGTRSGYDAPAGEGEWVTGGQALQDGSCVWICLRCATALRFKPSPEIYTAILQNGLLGAAPPAPEHMIVA